MTEKSAQLWVIEDNLGDIRLLESVFEEYRSDISLKIIKDGKTFFKLIRGDYQRPNLILLDLNLPGLDGKDILTAFKKSKLLKSIPIIVWSSSAHPELLEECRAAEANLVMEKPGDYDGYVGFVQRILSDYLN